MNPLDLLGPWKYLVYAAAAAAVIGGATYAVHHYNDGLREEGREEIRHEWDAEKTAQSAEAMRLERARQSRLDQSVQLAAAREAGIRADADRARRSVSGLRDDLDAIQRASTQSIDTANNAVRVLSDVFGECSRSYSDLAEQADRATSEVKTLRAAWPK